METLATQPVGIKYFHRGGMPWQDRGDPEVVGLRREATLVSKRVWLARWELGEHLRQFSCLPPRWPADYAMDPFHRCNLTTAAALRLMPPRAISV